MRVFIEKRRTLPLSRANKIKSCAGSKRNQNRGRGAQKRETKKKNEQFRFVPLSPRNSVRMLASSSRPMPAEAMNRIRGRATAVGGSPLRRTTAAKSPNPQLQRRRRLDSAGARSTARTTVGALAAAAASSSSSSSSSDGDALPSPPAGSSRKRVVILGGTGRVGASTAAQLARGPGGDQLDLVLVGKPGGEGETLPSSSSSASSSSPSPSLCSASPAVAAACKKFPALARAIFRVAAVDSGDARALEGLFAGASCVIHCAGPFQSGGAGAAAAASEKAGEGKSSVPAPLAAAIRAKVPYVDVCDDPDWAKVRERERERDVLFERKREKRERERKEREREKRERGKRKRAFFFAQKKNYKISLFKKLALSANAEARAAGVPAITTAGVFPGLSGLMASHMCAVARLEAAPLGVKVAPRDDGGEAAAGARAAAAAAAAAAGGSRASKASSSSSPSSRSPPPPSSSAASSVLTATETSIPEGAEPSDPSRLRYSYFVAGSGGAGPAVLAATLLLAARDAAAWKDGARVARPAFSEPLTADFGRFVGSKTVYLIDLPEVEAAAADLRVPSVSARFATAPGVFNLGTALLARLVPKGVLGDRQFAAGAARVLGPLVAAADAAGRERGRARGPRRTRGTGGATTPSCGARTSRRRARRSCTGTWRRRSGPAPRRSRASCCGLTGARARARAARAGARAAGAALPARCRSASAGRRRSPDRAGRES